MPCGTSMATLVAFDFAEAVEVSAHGRPIEHSDMLQACSAFFVGRVAVPSGDLITDGQHLFFVPHGAYEMPSCPTTSVCSFSLGLRCGTYCAALGDFGS